MVAPVFQSAILGRFLNWGSHFRLPLLALRALRNCVVSDRQWYTVPHFPVCTTITSRLVLLYIARVDPDEYKTLCAASITH